MKRLKNNNILELFFRLLPVQIFVPLASSLANVINGLIIGNSLSDQAMCALGLATPLMSFLGALSSIVSGGAGILCGNYMGSGEKKKIDRVFSISLIVLTVSGLVLSAVCILFAGPLALLLGSDSMNYAETVSYIRGISLGIVPLLLLPCLMTFLQMCNKSSVSLLLTIVMAGFNTLFSLAAVRMLSTGIFGIGAATSLARALTLAIALVYLASHKEMLSFDISGFELKTCLKIMKLGSPASLAGVLYGIRNVFINIYAGKIGGYEAVNALAIMASCGGFFDALNVGVGNTLTMLASVFIGEKDARSIKRLAFIAAVVGLVLAGFKLIIAYGLGERIALLFNASGGAVFQTATLLVYYCWSAPFNILTLIIMGIHQCLGRVILCNIVYVFNCLITPFVCCRYLALSAGIKGVYSSYYLAEIVTLIIFYLYASWKERALVTDFVKLIRLDDSFIDPKKVSRTLYGMEDVINMSVWIGSFLKQQGIDERRCMAAALCMEEMAGNIVEHGFEKDRKENSIDVFAGVENGEVRLRLRDNCVAFDPDSKSKILDPDDPCRNVGIRLVYKLAKQINYQTTFGMNVLTITL